MFYPDPTPVKAEDRKVGAAARSRAARHQKSLARRQGILDAATRLFLRDGYLETTMAAIAAEAEVAVQTLYLAFGSKVAILDAAHDAAVVGAGDDLPVLDRPWVEQVHAEGDGRRALALLLDNALGIVERVSPVYGVIHTAAADAEVAELLARTKLQRLHTMEPLAADLAAKSGFAVDMPTGRAIDLLYTMISDDQYRLLVVERAWPPEQWRAWCGDVLASALFPATTTPARPPLHEASPRS